MMRCATVALLLACFCAARLSLAATPSEVEKALEKGKDYLYKQMEKDGTWEHGSVPTRETILKDVVKNSRWGGTTALMVYALLAGGERPGEPRLAKAIEFLKKTEMVGTYPIAVRILAMSYLPETPDVKAVIKKDQAALLAMVQTEDNARGMYDYVPRELRNASRERPSKKQNYSHSRAQYGLLGVWMASEMGLDSPLAYWKTAEEGWLRNQDASGGWNYVHPAEARKDDKVTVGRTAAGIASLYLVQDYTRPTAELRGNPKNPAIDKAMAWLGQNYAALLASHGKDDYLCSSLYVVERAGVASGVKYIGGKDWFDAGADVIIKEQRADGGMPGQGGSVGVDTAFAVLFLARGRSPVIVEKLQYDTGAGTARKEGLWNQRPRDIANIVRQHSRQIEREVNWQIADLKMPGKELFDAPILYISGAGLVAFNDDEQQKLQAYVRGGGLIVCHADGSDAGFSSSMQKLGQKLFGGYEFRALPENHLAFSLVDRKGGGPVPHASGLSNGVREMMLVITAGDPARRWQMRSFKADGRNAAAVMEGIMQYASEKKMLRYRGEDVLLAEDEKVKDEGTIKVARIEYAGNWDPEPGAWPRLGRYVHNSFKRKLVTENLKLADGALKDYQVAHLTGTAKFRLEPAAAAELKRFVEGGGKLIIDSAGGGTAFTESAEELVRETFGGQLNVLPASHPIFTAGGAKAGEVKYRTFAIKTAGSAPAGPRIRGVEVGGRIAVFVSAEDLTGGWVGYGFDGINGYAPDTALDLGARMLLSAGK